MVKVRRTYSIRRKRSILRNRIFWIVIIVVIIILLIIYFLIFSHFFQVNNIEITGTEGLNQNTIKEFIDENTERTILFWPTRSIFSISQYVLSNKTLKYFPQIEKLEIKKKLPRSLIVSIKERKPIISFCRKESCFLTDKNGVAFERISQENNLLVIKDVLNQENNIELGSQVIDKGKLSNILKIFSTLENKNLETKFITIETPHKLSFRDKNEFDIYFDLEEDIEKQLFNLDTILKEKIPQEKQKDLEYIDLRFGNRVFWKYKSS